MRTWDRRRVLAGLGAGALGALAGCVGGEDPEPGLHVASAIVHRQQGDHRYDFPEDAGVRVNVENTSSDTQTGTVRVRLVPARSDADGWTKEREITVGGALPRRVFFVFEDVAESSEDEFDLTATIETAD